MLSIDDILLKAEQLTLETQIDSITPARVGELLTSLAEQLRMGTGGGVSIGASKLSELTDVMLLNAKDNDVLQKIGTKWTNSALNLTAVNKLLSWFKLDTLGNLYTDLNFYSTKGISAYGAGADEGSIISALSQLADVSLTSPLSGQILVYDGTHWRNQPLSVTPDLSGYATISWSNLTFALSAHSHTWEAITGKPTTFTPSAHNHIKSQISDFAHSHLWADLTDKPATFTPSAHTHAFADLTSKPTTLAGYGITDALLSSVYTAHAGNQNAEKHLTAQQLSDLLALINAPSTFWKLDVNGNLYTEKNVYSTLGISAYGSGTGGSGVGGASALYQLVDASITSPAVDHLLVYNGTHWQNRPKSYLLADYSLTTHGHTFASLTAKPTTLSGYGITDALLATAYTASDVFAKVLTQDGHGTGLDADTLDGKHGSYFCDYDERTLGYNVNYNTISYDFQNKSFIVSPVHSKNFTGQTNFPFSDYGQMITFGGLSSLFPFQLAVSENVTKLKIRSKYRPDNNTVMDSVWVDIYTSNNANRSDVNWTANTLIATTDITLNTLASTDKSVKNFINKFNAMFDTDVNGNIIAKTNLYSVGGISAYQSGAGVSGLKLMGDMNANGKNITGANTVIAGDTVIGNDPLLLLDGTSPGLYDADNDGIIAAYNNTTGKFHYANGNLIVDYSGVMTTTTMKANEFKFGLWSFKEVNGNMVIYYNGTAKATIQSSRTNSNL